MDFLLISSKKKDLIKVEICIMTTIQRELIHAIIHRADIGYNIHDNNNFYNEKFLMIQYYIHTAVT